MSAFTCATNPMTPSEKIDYDLAGLVHQNKLLKDGVNRQMLFIEAMDKYGDEIRLKEWSSLEDMRKAEAILYHALRSVLLPKDSTKPFH